MRTEQSFIAGTLPGLKNRFNSAADHSMAIFLMQFLFIRCCLNAVLFCIATSCQLILIWLRSLVLFPLKYHFVLHFRSFNPYPVQFGGDG